MITAEQVKELRRANRCGNNGLQKVYETRWRYGKSHCFTPKKGLAKAAKKIRPFSS